MSFKYLGKGNYKQKHFIDIEAIKYGFGRKHTGKTDLPPAPKHINSVCLVQVIQ